MSKEKYSGFIDHEGVFFGKRAQKTLKGLPSGSYTLGFSEQVGVLFEAAEINHDAIIDLPSPEYTRVMRDLSVFLAPGTKEKFQKHGFVYKRSALLHGKPGTGKTCIVNRVIQKVKEVDGIVLFNPDVELLSEAFKMIDNIEPNRLVLVVFEEFEDLLQGYENKEDTLLSLLDGEIQKNNVMYLATTNYIDKVPARIMRPGRFSSVIEVGFPTPEARLHYLNIKLPNQDNSSWAERTTNFSIDDLKETVLCVECLDYTLDEAIDRMKGAKEGLLVNSREGADTKSEQSTKAKLEELTAQMNRNMNIFGQSTILTKAQPVAAPRKGYTQIK